MTSRSTARSMATVLGGILSCLVLAVPAYSVESLDSPSRTPIEELVELDEVKVRGKLVANAVITAENRLFRRYNKLNKVNRYDVSCRDVPARDSLALLRLCVPEFLARQSASVFYPTGSSSSGGFSRCSLPTAGFDPNGGVYFQSSCLGSTSSRYIHVSSPTHHDSASNPSGMAPTISVEPARAAEFKKTMASVLSSDPELYEMAVELAAMYEEVARVEARYAELQEERRAAQKARREAARAGGRTLRTSHPRFP